MSDIVKSPSPPAGVTLHIKPLVIPRRFHEGRLYFYVVFTFSRVTTDGSLARPDSTTLPLSALPPFMTDPDLAWPTWLFERLKNQLCEFGIVDTKQKKKSTAAMRWNNIRLESPFGRDPGSQEPETNWGVVWKNNQWEFVDVARWKHYAAEMWQDLVVKSLEHLPGEVTPKTDYWREQNLGDLYWDHAHGNKHAATPNPTHATDLRPGLRLESLDSRSLARGLQQARNQVNPANASQPASERARADRQSNTSDPSGLQTLRELTLPTKRNEFQQFIAYLMAKDTASAELATFIVGMQRELRRTYPKPPDGEVAPDIKFQDLLDNQLKNVWNGDNVWSAVDDAYQQFLIHRGQTEVRRHSRFVDSALHRLVIDPKKNPPNQVSAFRTISHKEAVPSSAPAPYVDFEGIVAQIQRHPGLMRRMGLAVHCSVEWATPDAKGSGQPLPITNSSMLQVLAWIRIQCDDPAPALNWFIEPPTPTECDLLAPTESNGGKPAKDGLFRAAPENRATFLAPNAPSDAPDVWQQYHVLPSAYYLVTQDDYSLIAARSDMSITQGAASSTDSGDVATDQGAFHRQEVNSVNFYFAPLNEKGEPVTVAEWLHEHLKNAASKAALANQAMKKVASARRTARIVAASRRLEPTVFTTAFLDDLTHEVHAEQLMQGYTIDAYRPGKDATWRSLCFRQCTVEFVPEGSIGADPNAFTKSWLFGEEGFLASSAIVAPRPYVGPVTAYGPVDQGPGDFMLTMQVINTDNTYQFDCKGRVSFEETNFSWIVHPTINKQKDLLPGDVVLATPFGSPKKDANQQDITVTDLAVHPVFHTDALAGEQLQALGELLMVVATNTPRPNTQYPILLAAHGTRYVKTNGDAIVAAGDSSVPGAKDPAPAGGDAARPGRAPAAGPTPVSPPAAPALPPDFKDFTVEGERRYYSAAWVDTQPVVAVTTAKPSTVLPQVIGVLNAPGPVNAMMPQHLNVNTDSIQLFVVPNSEASVPTSRPDAAHPFGLTGATEQYASLDDSALIAVRGQVTNVTWELLVHVRPGMGPPASTITLNMNDPWQIVGGSLPSVTAPSLPGQPARNWSLTLSGDAMIPAQRPVGMVLHIIANVNRNATGDGLVCTATQCDIVAVLSDNNSPRTMTSTWKLSLKDLTRTPHSVTYADPDATNRPLSASDRFIHPAASIGWYLEAFGDRGPAALTGRGLPQFLLGTLANQGTTPTLYFTDGTKLAVGYTPPANASLPLSNLFQVYHVVPAANGAPPTAVPYANPSGNTDCLVVAGEIVTMPTDPDASPYSVGIRDLAGNTWSIRWPDSIRIRPTFSGLPLRPANDLELGEFLIARCDVDIPTQKSASWNRNLVVQPARLPTDGSIARACVCLLGQIDLSKIDPLTGIEALAEGSTNWDQFDVTTLQKQRLSLWYQRSDANTFLPGKQGVVQVVALSVRVIFAETVTQYAPPTQPPKTAKPRLPVHATVSEVLARWGGWTPTVPMPGKTDPQSQDNIPQANQNALFRIRSERPNLEIASDETRDMWRLPTLRFDQPYWFCVRRVDLAGNHFYDEHLPRIIGDLPNLPSNARSTLTTWLEQAESTSPHTPEAPERFERADDPSAPALAFARGRSMPAYVTNRLNPKVPTQPEPPDCDIIAYRRPRELLLLSDAFGKLPSATPDSQAFLLPPPFPVETVLLQGKLDGMKWWEAGEIIRRHDRQGHLICKYDQQGNLIGCEPPLMGVYPNGDLNYFGDVGATNVTVEVTSCDTVPQTGKPQAVELMCPTRWPCAQRVELQLREQVASQLRPRGVELPGLLSCNSLPDTNAASTMGQVDAVVVVRLPKGTVGSALLRLKKTNNADRSPPTWRSIKLIHATNAAMSKPRWDALAEIFTSDGTGAASTNRTLNLTFHTDRPSSGTYKVVSYWNECWDEAVAKQHQPADFVLLSDRGVVKQVRCLIPGFGFGSTAVVLLGESQPGTTPPLVQVVPRNGRVDDACVKILNPGKNCPAQIPLQVMRRPPLARIAQGDAQFGNGGAIEKINVSDGGGWYQSPPFVVAIDPTGDGSGADLRAVLDEFGAVCHVKVNAGGCCYSEDTVIGFYTHHYEFAEQTIDSVANLRGKVPPPGKDFDFDSIAGKLNQPFGDARSREVDYLIQVNSRFRDYLAPDPKSLPAGIGSVGVHVPRFSAARQLVLGGQVTPRKPDVAYMMHSFQWKVSDCPHCSLADARSFFLKRQQGRVAVRREASVRIYLFRPWNVTGIEQLGVVVLPAIQNTVRVPTSADPADDDHFNGGDRGVYNPLVGEPMEAGYNSEQREWYMIPAELRNFVSRIGFDPVWNEAAFPPLTVDQFKARRPDTNYEDISNDDVRASTPGAAPPVHALAWIAAHDVHYDSVKECWYADLRIDFSDQGNPVNAVPFVQLALVTYQPNGTVGNRVSPVYQCDMIKLLGNREVELQREDRLRFSVALRGQFDQHENPAQLPLRQVFAKLQSRSANMSDEIVVYQPAATGVSPRSPAARSGILAKPSGHADLLTEIVLEYRADRRDYFGNIVLDKLRLDSIDKNTIWSLAVEEYEVCPAAEAELDATGDSLVMIRGQKCGRQLVFSYTFDIEACVSSNS